MTDGHTYIHTYRKWLLNVLSDVKIKDENRLTIQERYFYILKKEDLFNIEENSDDDNENSLNSNEEAEKPNLNNENNDTTIEINLKIGKKQNSTLNRGRVTKKSEIF